VTRDLVAAYWSHDGPRPSPTRILPDGCVDVLVYLGEPPRAVVVGAMTTYACVPATVESRIVAARLRPGAAGALFGGAADALTDRDVAIEDLGWRLPIDERWRELAYAREALRRALSARSEVPDARVRWATRALWDGTRVEAVAEELGWSRQHLARRFRGNVGVSPKAFARIARMQRALRVLAGESVASLAEVAARLGYFDEAHMARDFGSLAGVTPGQARRQRSSILPIPPPV
jgi:AraC-like DNA-binding protein